MRVMGDPVLGGLKIFTRKKLYLCKGLKNESKINQLWMLKRMVLHAKSKGAAMSDATISVMHGLWTNVLAQRSRFTVSNEVMFFHNALNM